MAKWLIDFIELRKECLHCTILNTNGDLITETANLFMDKIKNYIM